MPTRFRQMADWTRGLVDRTVFSDPELYRQEMDEIFGRAWLFVGHVG